jgi:hypothetical protein
MALSGHANAGEQCLLSGAKQTWLKDDVMSAYEKRTLGPRFRLKPFAKIWSAYVCADRQAHREDRALARLARHRHVAAHHARELAREGKTEPGAAVAARGQRPISRSQCRTA